MMMPLEASAVISLVLGLLFYCVPNFTVGLFAVDQLDGVHWHLARVFGAIQIAHAFAWNNLRHSRDEIARVIPHVTYLISCVLIIAVNLHASAFHGSHLHNFSMTLCNLYLAVLLAVQLDALRRSGSWTVLVRHAIHHRETAYARLAVADGFGALLVGSIWLALPDLILHKQVAHQLMGTHLWLGRVFGAAMISTAAYSFCAMLFHDLDDRKQAIHARTLICTLIFSAQIWSQIAYGEWWTGRHWVGITLHGGWTGLAVHSCYQLHIGTVR